ncbi:universal stress protein [Deinococcus sp. KSM4-11]|uniref:universal stress protein n=1 Tax=Deinococcus sp. KSM4-11 TaxID=2568654 RepID=UPI0010A42969|nr:universal stress protein [Deinococcus sp. KSM4-11]THF88737.1 universal stress protein [Deinococcus sp. KSM4-11]
MTRILVTTDSSDLGHLALDHARPLADALHAELVTLYVQVDPVLALAGEFAYAPVSDPAALAAEADAVRADLTRRVPGARVRIDAAKGQSVAQMILKAVAAERADLIVMSTHGRSGLGRVLIGSVAEAVVHAAPVPVLLVRAGHTPTQWTAPAVGSSAEHSGVSG